MRAKARNGAGGVDGNAAAARRKSHARLMRRLNMTFTVIMMVAAVVLMSWPWIMQQVTASGMLDEVTHAESTVGALSDEARAEYLAQATAYNAMIARDAGASTPDVPDVGTIWRYEQQLTYQHDPMMSWVDVPSIGVSLPIYHGTTEDTLMNGVGHLEGTSLPVGGASTHCVLTAHSGMAGATMFDDIRMLHPGDLVLLHTMSDTLAYRVTGSEVVLPDEMGSLKVEDGRDLLTLVTCTPYGVNDHRLLVHCERTTYDAAEADDARSPMRRHYGIRDIAFFVAVGVSAVVLVTLVIRRMIVKRHRKRDAIQKADADAARRTESVPDGRDGVSGMDGVRHADTALRSQQQPHSGHQDGMHGDVQAGRHAERRRRRVTLRRDACLASDDAHGHAGDGTHGDDEANGNGV